MLVLGKVLYLRQVGRLSNLQMHQGVVDLAVMLVMFFRHHFLLVLLFWIKTMIPAMFWFIFWLIVIVARLHTTMLVILIFTLRLGGSGCKEWELALYPRPDTALPFCYSFCWNRRQNNLAGVLKCMPRSSSIIIEPKFVIWTQMTFLCYSFFLILSLMIRLDSIGLVKRLLFLSRKCQFIFIILNFIIF